MSTGPDTAPDDGSVPPSDAAGTGADAGAGSDAAQEPEPTPGSDNDGAEAGYSPPSQT